LPSKSTLGLRLSWTACSYGGVTSIQRVTSVRHSIAVSASSPPAASRSFWIAVISGAVILTIGIGARQSFGIFQKPIAADLHVGRELWSFATALAMLLMGRSRRLPGLQAIAAMVTAGRLPKAPAARK
jgi:hypothetical protein